MQILLTEEEYDAMKTDQEAFDKRVQAEVAKRQEEFTRQLEKILKEYSSRLGVRHLTGDEVCRAITRVLWPD